MFLKSTGIAIVSRLLDEALDLAPADQESWLAALAPEHQRHAGALRQMLAQAALSNNDLLESMPKLAGDESVAQADDRVGPYKLLHEIGRGGMGSVWLASRADGAYKRQVALKLPRLSWGAGLAERMAREREIGMLLEHPNIARLYDAGIDERGRPFLALEFIDGQPIDAWCEAKSLTVRDRLQLFIQVVGAVAYAHGRLVVHRDLKPSNVLVTADGQVHLLDFGIAKLLQEAAPGMPGLTQEQGRVLTPHYASPEQVAGDAITVQSDVYSLGVLLYELLTGTLPIAPRRDTLGAVEDAILQGGAPLASSRAADRVTAKALRGEVDAILAKAMQREPARRYATADMLGLDITRHLNGETVTARPDSAVYRLRKAVRRHWLGVSAVAAVVVAVLSGSGIAVVQAQRAARSTERERVVKAFVYDVFRVGSRADARNTALRPASPQALIEGGAQLIQQRFAGQPELQAELFAVVGSVFSDMGAYRLAAEYSTRRVETLATSHADAADQLRALLALAQALVDDRRFADAEPRIRGVLQQHADDVMLMLEARVLLAQVLLELGRVEECRMTLDAVDATLKARGGSPTLVQAKALFVRGRLLRQQNQADESVEKLQRALDIALTTEGRLSTTAAAVRLVIARFHILSDRDDLAKAAMVPAVAALRELGGAHEARALMAEARFAWFRREAFQMGTTAEALAVIQGSEAALAGLALPTPESFAQELAYMRGEVLLIAGDVQHALELIEPNAPPLLASSSTPVEGRRVLTTLARAQMWSGRHETADKALREVVDALRNDGWIKHPYAVSYITMRAQNLRMMGQFDAAMAVLDAAPQFPAITGEGGTNAMRYAREVDWERSKVLIDREAFPAALALLKTHQPLDGELAGDRADYEEMRGVAECVVGLARDGLPRLKRALGELADPADVATAPWRAHLHGRLGLCALAAGDRGLALESARLARAAFVAQPLVSPYCKAPLFKLERALRLRLPPV